MCPWEQWSYSKQLADHYGIEDEELLTKLYPEGAPAAVVHGTTIDCYGAILQDGLYRGQRSHVHFVGERATHGAGKGLKSGSEILLWVDLHRAMVKILLMDKILHYPL